jgi:hypothetical protein
MSNRRSPHASRARLLFATAASVAVLAACGGGGASDPAPPPPPPPPHALFVADAVTGGIAAFADRAPAVGSNVVAAGVLVVANTNGPIAYDDVHDLLYVATTNPADDATGYLEVYEHASQLAGPSAPARRVALPDSMQVEWMAVDGTSDTLWVSYRYRIFTTIDDGIVRRVTSASTATDVGNDYVFTWGDWALGAAYDPTRDVGYATDGNSLVVFPAISVLHDWLISPAHAIGTGIDGVSIALDPGRDIVYIADAHQALWVVQQASGDSPTLVGPIALPAVPQDVTSDPADDRLYVGAGGHVYLLDHASTLAVGASIPAPAIDGGGASSPMWSAGAQFR